MEDMIFYFCVGILYRVDKDFIFKFCFFKYRIFIFYRYVVFFSCYNYGYNVLGEIRISDLIRLRYFLVLNFKVVFC